MNSADSLTLKEQDVQHVLYSAYSQRRHEYITPNTTLFGFESDLITVTPAGFAYEFEIKLTRADYQADTKKHAKHMAYANAKHNPRKRERNVAPNAFYYVTPENLLENLIIPEHAGHIEVIVPNGRAQIRLRKKAPHLHHHKLPETQLQYLARGLMIRYWNTKTTRPPTQPERQAKTVTHQVQASA